MEGSHGTKGYVQKSYHANFCSDVIIVKLDLIFSAKLPEFIQNIYGRIVSLHWISSSRTVNRKFCHDCVVENIHELTN